MALSIAQFAQVSNWYATTNPQTITGLSWSAGDIIVVIGGAENAATTQSTPTNANLTFTLGAESTSGSFDESSIHVWTATAGSTQSSQTVSVSGGGAGHRGAAAWVVTGSPTGVANATANLTESAISRTVSAGSVVVYGFMDWNATNPPGKTPLTGSGTATERRDSGNGSSYAQYLCEWVGTSAGTYSFGPSNYTSLKVAQAIIEITAPAGDVDATATPSSIAVTTTVGTSTESASSTLAATSIASTTTIPAPTVTAGSAAVDATVTPSAILSTSSIARGS